MAIEPASVGSSPLVAGRAVGSRKTLPEGEGRVEAPPRGGSGTVDSPGKSVGEFGPALREDQRMEPPAGTDPQLWSVLTAEERRYFAQLRTLGPLIYRPGRLGLADFALPRGGRLDVSV